MNYIESGGDDNQGRLNDARHLPHQRGGYSGQAEECRIDGFRSCSTGMYSPYIEELEWKCDSVFPRWMSGKHLLLHEDEWIAATSLPRHGTFQASRRKDLPALFLHSTSWATWPISCSELFLRSQSGLLVTSCQLRGSSGAFA